MAKRYRLLGRAHLDGAVREAGYIFALPLDADGKEVLGPHKTVEHGADKIDLRPDAANAGARIPGRQRDVPMYEEVPEGEEISPTVDRSSDIRGAEMAMAGGSRVVEDEQRAATDRQEKLKALDAKGDDLTDDERKERDELRKRVARPHIGESDPQHAGGQTKDADWQGEKPPQVGTMSGPGEKKIAPDAGKFDETLKDASRSETATARAPSPAPKPAAASAPAPKAP